MSAQLTRTFTFLVPSNLTINWAFEFHCIVFLNTDNTVDFFVEDDNVGFVHFKMDNPNDNTRLFLYAWQRCSVLAADFVIAQTDRDARASKLAHPSG